MRKRRQFITSWYFLNNHLPIFVSSKTVGATFGLHSAPEPSSTSVEKKKSNQVNAFFSIHVYIEQDFCQEIKVSYLKGPLSH